MSPGATSGWALPSPRPSSNSTSCSSLYIGKQGLESTYGAADSLVVLLIWVYYGWQRLFKPVFALSPAARICLSGMLIGIGGIAFYAWHVGESTAQSLVNRMHRCATVLDDTAATKALALANPQRGRTRLPFLWALDDRRNFSSESSERRPEWSRPAQGRVLGAHARLDRRRLRRHRHEPPLCAPRVRGGCSWSQQIR
jgi:hypothetical protein